MDYNLLIKELFEIKDGKYEAFKVKIINCSSSSYWYSDRIDEIFDVIDNGSKYLKTIILFEDNSYLFEGAYIEKKDAIIYKT